MKLNLFNPPSPMPGQGMQTGLSNSQKPLLKDTFLRFGAIQKSNTLATKNSLETLFSRLNSWLTALDQKKIRRISEPDGLELDDRFQYKALVEWDDHQWEITVEDKKTPLLSKTSFALMGPKNGSEAAETLHFSTQWHTSNEKPSILPDFIARHANIFSFKHGLNLDLAELQPWEREALEAKIKTLITRLEKEVLDVQRPAYFEGPSQVISETQTLENLIAIGKGN